MQIVVIFGCFVVLGMLIEIVRRNTLLRDSSPLGWAVKAVILLVAMALVALPLALLFKGPATQRAAARAARAGVAKGVKSLRSPVATLVDAL